MRQAATQDANFKKHKNKKCLTIINLLKKECLCLVHKAFWKGILCENWTNNYLEELVCPVTGWVDGEVLIGETQGGQAREIHNCHHDVCPIITWQNIKNEQIWRKTDRKLFSILQTTFVCNIRSLGSSQCTTYVCF